jgi:hypothetical protein
VHRYYHLVPLVCCYFFVGYLSDSIDNSRSSQLEWFKDVGMFPQIWLYSCRSDNPVRAL